jgi:hypothetical protein
MYPFHCHRSESSPGPDCPDTCMGRDRISNSAKRIARELWRYFPWQNGPQATQRAKLTTTPACLQEKSSYPHSPEHEPMA